MLNNAQRRIFRTALVLTLLAALCRLDEAWEETVAKHWLVVSMKDDWKTIFSP